MFKLLIKMMILEVLIISIISPPLIFSAGFGSMNPISLVSSFIFIPFVALYAFLYKIVFELFTSYAAVKIASRKRPFTLSILMRSRYTISVISLVLIDLVMLTDGTDFIFHVALCNVLHIATIWGAHKLKKDWLAEQILNINDPDRLKPNRPLRIHEI